MTLLEVWNRLDKEFPSPARFDVDTSHTRDRDGKVTCEFTVAIWRDRDSLVAVGWDRSLDAAYSKAINAVGGRDVVAPDIAQASSDMEGIEANK